MKRLIFALLFISFYTTSASAQLGIIAEDIARLLGREVEMVHIRPNLHHEYLKYELPAVSSNGVVHNWPTKSASTTPSWHQYDDIKSDPNTPYVNGVYLYKDETYSYRDSWRIVFQNDNARDAYEYFDKFTPLIILPSGKESQAEVTAYNNFINRTNVKYKLQNPQFTDQYLEIIKKEIILDNIGRYENLKVNNDELYYKLLIYQIDNALPKTGKLDEKTVDKLLGQVSLYHDINSITLVNEGFYSGMYLTSGTEYKQNIDDCLNYLENQKFTKLDLHKARLLDGRIAVLKYQIKYRLGKTATLDPQTICDILLRKYSLDNVELTRALPNVSSHFVDVALQLQPGNVELSQGKNQVVYVVHSGLSILHPIKTGKHFVYISKYDKVALDNSESIIALIDEFTTSLPENLKSLNNDMVVISKKVKKGEIIANIHFVDDHFVCYIQSLQKVLFTQSQFISDLGFIHSKKGSVIWIGDELKGINVVALADKTNVPVYRRFGQIYKTLPTLTQAQDKILSSKNTVMCNATPKTIEELRMSGFSAMGIAKWQSLAAELDKAANGKFGKSIVSKGELKTEIISGNNDVVLIIAHSNGLKLAIGNESISIDDIKSWEKTTIPSGRQRVAIMLVCDAANPHLKRGLFRRLESFTELLVGKGYFDMIIAPDHEINGNEAVKVLSEIIANKTLAEIRTLFPGWTGFVIINSVNKYNLISLK